MDEWQVAMTVVILSCRFSRLRSALCPFAVAPAREQVGFIRPSGCEETLTNDKLYFHFYFQHCCI